MLSEPDTHSRTFYGAHQQLHTNTMGSGRPEAKGAIPILCLAILFYLPFARTNYIGNCLLNSFMADTQYVQYGLGRHTYI